MKTNFVVGHLALMLRPVDMGDEEFVYQVYASTRSDEMALVNWTNEQKEAFLRMQVNAQAAHYKTHYPRGEQYIIHCNNIAVGRLILEPSDDSILIIDIALLPDARNAGIGTAIMKELMDEAGRENRRIVLRVEFFNPARRLYSRLGFVQTREMSIYHEMIWTPASIPA